MMQINTANKPIDMTIPRKEKEFTHSENTGDKKKKNEHDEGFYKMDTKKENAANLHLADSSLFKNNRKEEITEIQEIKKGKEHQRKEIVSNKSKYNNDSAIEKTKDVNIRKQTEKKEKKEKEKEKEEGNDNAKGKEHMKTDKKNDNLNEITVINMNELNCQMDEKNINNQAVCSIETSNQDPTNNIENSDTRNTENLNNIQNDVINENYNDMLDDVADSISNFALDDEFNLSNRTSRNLHICSFFVQTLYLITVLILIGKLSFDFSAKPKNISETYMKCLCGFLLVTLLTHISIRIYYSYKYIQKNDVSKTLKRFENYFHAFAIIFSLVCLYLYAFRSDLILINDTFAVAIILAILYYFSSIALFVVLHIILLFFVITLLILKKKSPTPKRILKKLKIMTYAEYRKFCQEKKYMNSSYFCTHIEDRKTKTKQIKEKEAEKETEREKEWANHSEKKENDANYTICDNTSSDNKINDQTDLIYQKKINEIAHREGNDLTLKSTEEVKNKSEKESGLLEEVVIVPYANGTANELNETKKKNKQPHAFIEYNPLNAKENSEVKIKTNNDATNKELSTLKESTDINNVNITCVHDNSLSICNIQHNNSNNTINKSIIKQDNDVDNEYSEKGGIFNFFIRSLTREKKKKEKNKNENYKENNTLHLSAENVDLLCSVCCIEYADDDDICVLPCNYLHYFHKACIFTWLKKNNECPFCRENIKNFFKRRKKKRKRKE